MVNAAYVQRASAAIGRAIPKLYGPLVLPLALWVTAGATVLSLAAMSVFLSWSNLDKAAVLLLLTGVAWWVVERRAYASLKAMLGDNLYARLKGQLGGIRDRYRFAMAGGFLFAWCLAVLILRLVGR